MKSRNRKVLAGLATGVLTMTLSACFPSVPSGPSESAGPQKDTLVVAQNQEVSSVDPSNQSNIASGQLVIQWAETLVWVDAEYQPQPMLAESVERTDDLTYDVALRKGVKFHNGEELKASDVVFSLTRAAQNTQTAGRLGELDLTSFEVIDDYRLTFKTTRPSATFLANLGHANAAIVSEKAATELGEDFSRDVTGAGTGPYKFVEWTPGVEVVLQRFDDYWGEQAKIPNLRYTFVPDGNSRTVALESGEVDVIYTVPATAVSTLEANSDVVVHSVVPAMVRSIFLNQGEGLPFENKLLRQAVATAIDRDALVKAAFGDTAEVATGYLADGVLGHTTDLETYDYDPERAKELLREAGFAPDEVTLTLAFWAQNYLVTMAEIIQANLADVGIKVELEQLEASAWIDALAGGQVQFGFNGVSAPNGDPDSLLYSHFFSGNSPAPNHGRVIDATLDELLVNGRTTFDAAERTKIYQEIERHVAANAYAYPLTHEKVLMASRANVTGLVLEPTNSTRFFLVSVS